MSLETRKTHSQMTCTG